MSAAPLISLAETITEVLGLAVTEHPEMATKLRKAAHIIDREMHRHIFPQGIDGCYYVESEIEDGVMYLVNITAGTCSCKAATHQPGACKHQIAVKLLKAASYVQRAKQRALDFHISAPPDTALRVAHLVAVA